jgi:hypothetical protein
MTKQRIPIHLRKSTNPLKTANCLLNTSTVGLQRWAFPKPDKASDPIVFNIPPGLIEEYLASGQSPQDFLYSVPKTLNCSDAETRETSAHLPISVSDDSPFPLTRDKTERLACESMARHLHGILEFTLSVGRIDVLTESTVFEVKQAHNWKHALGQVLVYGSQFPNRSKQIVLVGKVDRFLDIAIEHCKPFGVSVVSFQEICDRF